MTTAERHNVPPEAERTVAPEDPARPRQGRGRRRGIGLINLLVSAVALTAVGLWVSHQQAPTMPTDARAFGLLGAALLVHATTMVLRGWRWRRILLHSGIEHRASDAYSLIAVGYMGNTVLPARGGEVLRVLLLRGRSNGGRRQILGTIVAERVFDVLVLVALLVVVTGSGVSHDAVGWLPVLGAVGAIAVAAVGAAAYLHLRRRGAFERFAEIVRPFARASRVVATGLGVRLLLVSLVIWTLEGCLFALCGAALDLGVSVMEGLLLVVLANFFALIPAAPGYVGTYDAAVLFGTRAIGVRAGDAVGLALLARLISFVPVTLAGLVLLVTRYGGLRRLREAR